MVKDKGNPWNIQGLKSLFNKVIGKKEISKTRKQKKKDLANLQVCPFKFKTKEKAVIIKIRKK